jgi:uncharacterized protein (UPF0335 family)
MAKAPKKRKQESDIDDDPQFQTTREGANAKLASYLERIERIREEKKGLADDEKDIFTELKSSGYDSKTARRMLILRAMDKEKRDEMDALDATYREELGIPSNH